MQARELLQHIDEICIRNGLQYLKNATGIDSRLKHIIKELVIDPKIRILEINKNKD
jgi:hypothetical protein